MTNLTDTIENIKIDVEKSFWASFIFILFAFAFQFVSDGLISTILMGISSILTIIDLIVFLLTKEPLPLIASIVGTVSAVIFLYNCGISV